MEQWQYISALKAIAEAQISAAGMTAANEQRKVVGASMAYDDAAFGQVVDEMNAKVERALNP